MVFTFNKVACKRWTCLHDTFSGWELDDDGKEVPIDTKLSSSSTVKITFLYFECFVWFIVINFKFIGINMSYAYDDKTDALNPIAILLAGF